MFGSVESKAKYHRLKSEYIACGRSRTFGAKANDFTLVELVGNCCLRMHAGAIGNFANPTLKEDKNMAEREVVFKLSALASDERLFLIWFCGNQSFCW